MKVLFITGTSRGFGRIWAEAALKKGYKVIATARNIAMIDDLIKEYKSELLPIQLDVTDRAGCFAAIKKGHEHFGRIDVVINVAGISIYGAVEEATEREARAQLETNLLGPLWITQAVLPIMKKQRSGHIIQVSSLGAVVPFPILGLYTASKSGLEAFSEALAGEVKDFGISVTLIEPGVYETGPDGASMQEKTIFAYDDVRKRVYSQFTGPKGNPHATTDALIEVIEADEPPLRLFLGTLPFPIVTSLYHQRLQTWEKWKKISDAAQGSPEIKIP